MHVLLPKLLPNVRYTHMHSMWMCGCSARFCALHTHALDVDVCAVHVWRLTDLGLLPEQAPGHEVFLEVGAEEAWGPAEVVGPSAFGVVL